ncbi:MAG TPA: cadherin-like beta sandwich domain-containing protein [Symbiobacteriaceae bacterium]|nr:cadherin-like beta sandwich domain-containing protein [Symbiobacteriaceae bacterium]
MRRRIIVLLSLLLVALTAVWMGRAVADNAGGQDLLRTKLLLKDLTFEGLQLQQPFNPNRIQYGVSVPNRVSEIKVKAEAALPEAFLTVNGVTPGAQAQSVKLDEGMNVLRVTLQHGNLTRQYIVLITREEV